MLYEVVLNKKLAVSQITCNPTLDAFDLDYCKILDDLATTDKFVEDRVGICIKELGLAGGIDFNGHYINAFDAYNEAVTYYDMLQRGAAIRNIPEASSSTPDFEVGFSYKNWEGEQIKEKVYLEVKSLAYANGNLEYNKAQKTAFESNIRLEQQRETGRRFCSSEYCISPLGDKDTGPTSEIEEFIKKINNNIKPSQFSYGNGADTVLFVDLSQYMFPFQEEECLPVYPDVIRKYSASGRLWMIAFGRENDRVLTWPEFDGKGNFDRDLSIPGILNCHDYIKGIIFAPGQKKGSGNYMGSTGTRKRI